MFLGLVAVNAAIGIAVLIAGGLGRTGGRILLTSLTLTGAVMIGLACSTGRSTPSLERVWPVGVACTAAACVLLIAGIWGEPDSEVFWKAVGSFVAVCVAVALVSLAGLPSLPDRWRWTFAAAEALTTLLCAMVMTAIWAEIDTSWFARAFGAVAVALAAFLLVIPVLSRVRPSQGVPGIAATVGRVDYCPNCGQPLAGTTRGETHCPGCDVTFEVRFRVPEVHGVPTQRGETGSRSAAAP